MFELNSSSELCDVDLTRNNNSKPKLVILSNPSSFVPFEIMAFTNMNFTNCNEELYTDIFLFFKLGENWKQINYDRGRTWIWINNIA